MTAPDSDPDAGDLPEYSQADKDAAEALLSELVTRIVIQPLPYQFGIERKALESLYAVFDVTRAIIRDNPGCLKFAARAFDMLNCTLRPVTSKWDRPNEDGALESRDGGDAFRVDFADVQEKLLAFAGEIQRMAHGDSAGEIKRVDHPLTRRQLDALIGTEIAYGIPANDQIEVHKSGGIGVAEINTAENQEVERRRAFWKDNRQKDLGNDGKDAIGMAFSGGGIRSATFCLGVTQVLAAKKLLPDVDFLSSVSGGGYAACFIARQLEEDPQVAITAPPDARKATDLSALAGPHGPDPEPIRYLRNRAKYLMATDLWDAVGMVTSTVMGMLLHWLAPLVIVIPLAILFGHLFPDFENDCWSWLCGSGGGLVLVSGLLFFGALRLGKPTAARRAGWLFATLTVLTAALFLGWLADWLYGILFLHDPSRLNQSGNWANMEKLWSTLLASRVWVKTGLGGTLSLGALASVFTIALRYLPIIRKPETRLLVTKITIGLAGFILPLIGFILFLLLCGISRVEQINLPASYTLIGGGTALLLWIFLASLLIAAVILNINLTGPHRLYRRGLSKTFIGKRDDEEPEVPLNGVGPDQQTEPPERSRRVPYQLINAAANLPSSTSPGLRERRADFFLFSKHWMGSPVLGYHPTGSWKMNGRAADLATAMATSGAAFSSNMGLGSLPPLRALLTVLNIRLGFWIRQPGKPFPFGKIEGTHPSFVCLLREMTGLWMDEQKAWINLSDGGHIENLATYELLRRRCKFIICVDGESDPGFTFHGLMTLIRHAQIDLGIRIDPQLDDLRPGSATGYSRTHYHLCRIHYPQAGKDRPEATGLLLYIKLSVTGNESELIRRYRINNPAFPHQTTLDQFFDEEQFEAYRQLGVHAAEGLFSRCLMRLPAMPEDDAGQGGCGTGDQSDPDCPDDRDAKFTPISIKDWFRRLAANLLLPELDDRPLKPGQ
ncbi:patatin-like phospholipase family protein [Luteolibacter marinus]|uniref:patatin-like phospholipase family protein n=1 Tax=Luteolibacter marinus TaxID=2776705 RepID=UPI00186742DB|nr:patatin-like phospholipase family protein [Luteolibacter marinus]